MEIIMSDIFDSMPEDEMNRFLENEEKGITDYTILDAAIMKVYRELMTLDQYIEIRKLMIMEGYK